MNHAKKSLVGLIFLLVGFSGAAWTQDKPLDKAAIVDSFKQEIRERYAKRILRRDGWV